MAAPKILVPFPRVRKKGTVGRDVQQDRRALTRAGVWPVNTKTTPHSYYDSPQFTHKFALAVREYQRRQKLPITGEMDRATHNRLARPYRSKNGSLHAFGFYGGAGAKVMEDVQKKLIAQERYLLNSGSVTQRGVAAALMCVRHRDAIHYTQGGLRMQGVNRRLYPPDYPHYGDCSAMATWWYFVAGAPDPNGLGYNGLGYCHDPDARLLTADLRWKRAGDVAVGEELWAFDDEPVGDGRGRRFRRATVLASFPSVKPCVRVTFANGESHVCSADHPWLAQHRQDGPHDERHTRWVTPDAMVGETIVRPFMPWEPDTSYEAGWLAGMFDGEGWVVNRSARGGRTNGVGVTQAVGPTADRLVAALEPYSFTTRTVKREGIRDRVEATSNGGGLPAAMEFLGRIRPERLIASVTIEGGVMRSRFGSQVVSVEPIGLHEVQSIQTTEGTYFAEGYAVHNTGTQAPRGSARSSWNAPAMALVFYGSGRTIKHVAMKVKPSLVVSHGSEIGPVLVSVGYRPPIVCKVFNLNVRPGFRPWPVRKAAA